MFLSEKQIYDYQNDGAIIIKDVFKDWIEPLRKGFQKVLDNPSKHGRENVTDDNGRFFEDYCNWERIDEFKDCLDNILPNETKEEYLELFKTEWCQMAQGFSWEDQSTWTSKNLPIMLSKGMAVYSGWGQSEFMWSLRTNPRIYEIFDENPPVLKYPNSSFFFEDVPINFFLKIIRKKKSRSALKNLAS